MPVRRTSTRTAAVALAAGAVVAMAAAPASAHVTVTPDTTTAGAYAVLTFSVPHGCEGSPTTEVAIAMPPEVNQVTPTRNALWTVEKQMEQLDEPVTDSHGNEITERVGQVVYTARQPLPEGYRDAFELSLQLPDAAGETLVFPVVQTCEEGEAPWTETPAEGQDAEELERPAPAVTLTAAEGASGDPASATEEPEVSASEADDADEADDGGDGLALAGLVAGLIGILVGGAALLRSRKA